MNHDYETYRDSRDELRLELVARIEERGLVFSIALRLLITVVVGVLLKAVFTPLALLAVPHGIIYAVLLMVQASRVLRRPFLIWRREREVRGLERPEYVRRYWDDVNKNS